ncbi:MAG: Superoxide dismutase-like protein YojM precursor [Firmicutes bacterium ADurb.Bin193]|nr:MAG: Superoxide dismutase-like protein YojM precursor [Firmicutes bacterium ADurb.Bin193]
MIRNRIIAFISGGKSYPDLKGTVTFRPMMNGTLVSASISGLPGSNGFHGFHLHEGGECDFEHNFESAKGHYNPENKKHPYHAGDFPPLLSAGGSAFSEFYTDRITPNDAVGKTVIIHSAPDDFRTDPSGNSGNRIACGVVRKI